MLVDGLGWHLLGELAGSAPLLASVLAGQTARLTELTCTFPSTTPTSLVSLGTGAQPGEHGILGFTLNVPGTNRVLNHILWRDDPAHAEWQPLPTWFGRLNKAGVSARAVLPAAFMGSGLTDSAYRGAVFRPIQPADDNAQKVADELHAAPGLVYGYTAALDTAAHAFGVGSSQWHEAAAVVDGLLTRLVETLPPNAALLVTADHGGFNVPPDARVDLDTDPRLAAGVRVVAGEPRVRYLHTEPGAAAGCAGGLERGTQRQGARLQPGAVGGHRDVRAGQPGAPGANRRRRRRLHRRCRHPGNRARTAGNGSPHRLSRRGDPRRNGHPAHHFQIPCRASLVAVRRLPSRPDETITAEIAIPLSIFKGGSQGRHSPALLRWQHCEFPGCGQTFTMATTSVGSGRICCTVP